MGLPQGSYSLWFSLVQNVIALIAACAFAFLGGCVALVGALVIDAPKGWLARWAHLRFPRDLMTWGATFAYSSPADLEALARRFVQLAGWLLLGGGLGLLVASGALAWLAISVTGLPMGIMAGPWLGIAIIYFGFALGATLGHLAGTYAVTRVATGPTWADLRRRRVSDYRAGWLGWGPFALAGVTTLLLVAALFPQSSARDAAREFPISYLPVALPIPAMAALAAWALLSPIVGALLCRWIATSRRALTSANPQVARAADEMRRAISIGYIVSYTWVSSGLTLGAAMQVALPPPSGFIGVLRWLLIPLGPLVMGFGAGLNGLRGRLGGRVMGWPSLQSILAG